jgi:hypothetical protein
MNQHSSSTAWPGRDVDIDLQGIDEFAQLAVRAAAELHAHRRGADGLCPVDGSAFPCPRACCAAGNIALVRLP